MTCPGGYSCASPEAFFSMFFILGPIIFVMFVAMCFMVNRNYTEIAEDYWNREYLDYSKRLDNIIR